MAFAHIQGTGASTSGAASTNTATFGSSVTVGSLLVVGCSALQADSGAKPSFAVTDSKGNTYRRACRQVEKNGGSFWQTLEIWYAIATTGGTSNVVTTTPSLSSFCGMSIDEYSYTGTLTIQSVAANENVTIGAVEPSTGHLNVNGNDLVYGIGTDSDVFTGSWTAGTGTTLRYNTNFAGGTRTAFAAGEAINPGGTTFEISYATGGSKPPWQCLGVSFGVQGGTTPVNFIQCAGETSQGTVSTQAVKFPASVSVGDLVIVGVAISTTNSAGTVTISDDAGNTYTRRKRIISIASRYQLTEIWSSVVSTGGTLTVTATPSEAVNVNLSINHYTIPAGYIMSVDSTDSATSGQVSLTVNSPHSDLLVAMAGNSVVGDKPNTWTPGTGWNQRYSSMGTAFGTTTSVFVDSLNITSNTSTALANAPSGAWQNAGVAFFPTLAAVAPLLPAM